MKSWVRWLCTCLVGVVSAGIFAVQVRGDEREEIGRLLKMFPPNGSPDTYGNVVLKMRSKKAGLAPVVFPHWVHRARYTCRVCHQELSFAMRRGESGITRHKLLDGRFCGACHDGVVAFTLQEGSQRHCDRCHISDTAGLTARFKTFASGLPRAQSGNGIDWNRAIAEGKLKPRNGLKEDTPPTPIPAALKKPLSLGTSALRNAVTFFHEEHFAEMDCSSCHPDIFNIKKKGTEAFSMTKNLYGRYCGTCHLRVAFPMTYCQGCHPQMGAFRQ